MSKKKPKGAPTREPSPAKSEVAAEPGFLDRRGTLVVCVMMALYSAVFITICLIKYAYFLYNDFDMAVYSQAAFLTIRGSLHSSILGLNFLGNHMSLLVFPISPMYAVCPHPTVLLVFQTVVLALGALPIYWLARRELRNTFLGVCFAALYLLYPALGYSNLYEFHPETLVTTTLLFAFYYMWVGRFWVMVLFAVLSLLGKENVPLVVMMMGLYSLLIRRSRRWIYAATLIVLAGVHLFVSFAVVMPAANRGEVGLENIYSQWGDSPGKAMVAMARNPVRVVKAFFVTPGNARDGRAKRQYYLQMLLPVLLLPLLSPLTLAITLPALAQHMLSSRLSDHTIVYHYTTQITPFVLVASVLGLRNLLRLLVRGKPEGLSDAVMSAKTPVRTVGSVTVIMAVFVAVGCNFLFGPLLGLGDLPDPPAPQRNWPTPYDRAVAPYMRRMVSRVPDERAVASGFRFLARLSRRRSVHSLHHLFKGSYTLSDKPYPVPEDLVAVIVDTNDWMYLSFSRTDGARRLRRMFESNRLEVAEAAGDVVLLLQEVKEPVRLWETPGELPRHSRRVDYNGQLSFLGWDDLPASVEVGGKLPIRTGWMRLGPVDRFYLSQFLLLDSYARPVFTHHRRLGYTFYPAHDWPPRGTVRETYNLVVADDVSPGRYTLALRVLEQVGRGLQVARPGDAELQRRQGMIPLGQIEVVPARR